MWQDLRFGARMLRKNRGFTFVAVVTLALGVGANTALFQLIDAVRLRTLPVKNADELVEVGFDHHGWYAASTDPLSIGLAALLMFAVTIAASYIPARRATKVDPMVALRYE